MVHSRRVQGLGIDLGNIPVMYRTPRIRPLTLSIYTRVLSPVLLTYLVLMNRHNLPQWVSGDDIPQQRSTRPFALYCSKPRFIVSPGGTWCSVQDAIGLCASVRFAYQARPSSAPCSASVHVPRINPISLTAVGSG